MPSRCHKKFLHTLLEDGKEKNSTAEVEEVLGCMSHDAKENGVTISKANLQNLLNPEDENHVTEKMTVQQLGREIAGLHDPLSDDEELYPSVRAQLSCLAVAKATLERREHLSDEMYKAFYEFQHVLRLEKQNAMTQMTIDDHFSKK